MVKVRIYPLLKLLISLALLGLLFYLQRGTIEDTIRSIRMIDRNFLLAGSLAYVAGIAVVSLRLNILMSAQALRVGCGKTAYLTYMGYFFNNFLPTSVGGDLVKAYYASNMTGEKVRSFISVFMDRFLGVTTLLMLAAISLVFSDIAAGNKPLVWFTLALFTALVFALTIFFNKGLARVFSPVARLAERFKLKKKLVEAYDAIHSFKDKKKALIFSMAISLAAQIICFSSVFFFSRGMGVPVEFKTVLVIMPLVSILSMLPSINGLGIREGAICVLFSPYIGKENALALSMLWLFVLLIVSVIGGICYLFKREVSNA